MAFLENFILLFVIVCAGAAYIKQDLELDFDDFNAFDDDIEPKDWPEENYHFVSTRNAKFSEYEVRLSLHGIKAIDTLTAKSRTNGLFYRIVTNGKRVIRAIFEGEDNLVDCDITTNEEKLEKFMDRFVGFDDFSQNESIRMIKSQSELNKEEMDMFDMRQLVLRCKDLQKTLRQEAKHSYRQNNEENSEVGPDMPADFERPAPQQGRRRTKRSMLIYPGTNWCGKGSSALDYNDLGDNVATDRCCRSHDFCPYTITGFTTKYGYFNYRFHTISHCRCDVTFRSCLKSTDNSVADMVGDIFFNVADTECFVLKPELQCKKRSWWGSCEEQTKTYKAVIEKPVKY